MTTETKSLSGYGVKIIEDAGEGVIEAIVSVTGVKDQVNDIIEPGAYTKTLKARKPKMVWSHDWEKPIGVTETIEELLPGDPRLPDHVKALGGGALVAKARFIMGTQLGREAYEVVKAFGADAEFSIGYNVPGGAATVKNGVRHIKTLDLFEYSPVLFGAMPHAKTVSLKSALAAELSALDAADAGDEVKAADGKDRHPFADRDRDGKCDICGVSKEKHGNALAPMSDEEKALVSLVLTEEACVDCGGGEQLEGKGVGEPPTCLECGGLVVEYALGEEDVAAMSDAEVKALGAQVSRADYELGLDDLDVRLAHAYGGADGESVETISAEELAGLKELGVNLELKGSRASLDRSPRSNWVEESGDLPGYVREIARAIEKSGKTLSQAIAIAISRIKVWAAGGGDVDADTRAKAAKALAEWEALKAKNAARKLGGKSLNEFTLSFVDDGADDLSAATEAAVEAVEVKAGRVLSTSNASKLKRALEDLVHVLRVAGALETQKPAQPTDVTDPKAEAEDEDESELDGDLVPAGGPPKAATTDAPPATEEKSRASAWVTQAAAAEEDTDVLSAEELAELRALRASL